ncbi:hypothetical protein Tco_0830631 [Tanacetum coccineum]
MVKHPSPSPLSPQPKEKCQVGNPHPFQKILMAEIVPKEAQVNLKAEIAFVIHLTQLTQPLEALTKKAQHKDQAYEEFGYK